MKKLYEFICKAEMFAAKYTLWLLAILVFAAAVARTIHHPINWAVDAATFLFAWTVFFGADIALRNDKLFCIDLITAKLPRKGQLYMKIINYVIIAAFLIGMIVYGSMLSVTTRFRTFQGIPGFSYTWVTISVPLGCALMLITVVLKIGGFFRMIRSGESLQKCDESATEII